MARYASALLDALSARSELRMVPVGDGPFVERARGRRLRVLRQDLVWHPWLGRRHARSLGASVYHAPSPRAPLARGVLPTVVTVHDLNFVVRPETVSSWNGRYSRATIRRVTAAADVIVADSQATADDLAHLVRADASRMRVVHLGVARDWFALPAAAVSEVERPFIVFVGTAEPRKNLGRLVDAVRRRRQRGSPERLVMAGAGGWGGVLVTGDADVRPLGRVDDDALRALYRTAACLVLPSLHEGFGLPALEAMAAGCPVVASRAGALPEVCGDAAVLVDPLDVEDIARGIDEALLYADDLRAAGRARAALFTWDRCAEQMARIYRELA